MAKNYEIKLSADAESDLESIADWIAHQSSSLAVALDYMLRLRTFLKQFQTFPYRGTTRDDLRPGLRLTGFERRVTIAFTVEHDHVLILRLFYAGRDIDALGHEKEGVMTGQTQTGTHKDAAVRTLKSGVFTPLSGLFDPEKGLTIPICVCADRACASAAHSAE